MLNRRYILAVLTTLAVALIAPAMTLAAVRGSFQRTLQVNGTVDLQVLTHSGDINVQAGPAGSVSISAKIHSGNSGFLEIFNAGAASETQVRDIEQNPPIRQTGNMVKIDYPPYKNISIDYDITVPADTRLKVETGSGNQTVRGLKGGSTLHAGSGDLRLDDLDGAVHVETGSGNIVGNALAGAFEARAGSGDIKLDLTGNGAVRAHTGSGNVQLRGVNGGVFAETGSGDVIAEGKIAGDWTVHTGSGDVTVRLPANSSYEVELSTSSGTLTVNDPVNTTVQGKVNEGGNRHHVAGKVRNGGPTLRVSTGSGDVRID
jgi:DUF4097 and DUF4098 domain-containing protein YvlB